MSLYRVQMCLIKVVFVCMCACAEPIKLLLLAAGAEFSSSLASNCKPQTYTHTKWSVKVYGGNAVVTPGNALSVNLPNHFSLPIISTDLRSKERKCISFTRFCFSFQMRLSKRKNITDLQLSFYLI